MVGRAVKTQVDAKGHRCPGRVLSTAVEADLCKVPSQPRAMGFARVKRTGARTLFAGFVFNFSNSFCDCCFDASPLIVATGLPNWAGLDWTGLQYGPDRGECVQWWVLVGRPKKQPT